MFSLVCHRLELVQHCAKQCPPRLTTFLVNLDMLTGNSQHGGMVSAKNAY